jgi:hypothetical protein
LVDVFLDVRHLAIDETGEKSGELDEALRFGVDPADHTLDLLGHRAFHQLAQFEQLLGADASVGIGIHLMEDDHHFLFLGLQEPPSNEETFDEADEVATPLG